MNTRILSRPLLAAVLLTLTAACEYIPFAGGQLDGTPTPAPADWSDVAAADIVALETNPADPYSVKLWIIGAGTDLYVHAGANRATWVEHIEQDSRVRLSTGDALYELQASRVASQTEFDAFSDLYEDKYGRRPRNEKVNEAYLFRLTPRG